MTKGTTDAKGEVELTYWNTNSIKSHHFSYLISDTLEYFFFAASIVDGEDKGKSSDPYLGGNVNADIILEFAPTAYFTVWCDNVDYTDEQDQLTYYWENLDVKNDDDEGGGGILKGDVDIGFATGGQMKAAGNHKIEWTVTREGITESFEDTFYIAPYDTVTYQINY
ncbi:hypothetical protein JYT72_00035 [Crocinitomix catalasitica]|nr:hypothetical protein [Crocinitomix catalasitica]